jgi:hypothetical protein
MSVMATAAVLMGQPEEVRTAIFDPGGLQQNGRLRLGDGRSTCSRGGVKTQMPNICVQAALVVREGDSGYYPRSSALLLLFARRRVPQPDRLVIRP